MNALCGSDLTKFMLKHSRKHCHQSQPLPGAVRPFFFFLLPSATYCQYQTCRPHSFPLLKRWIYFTAGTGLGRTPPSPSSSRHTAPTARRCQTCQQLSPVSNFCRNTVSRHNVEVLFSFRTKAEHNFQRLAEETCRENLELFNNYHINVLSLIP